LAGAFLKGCSLTGYIRLRQSLSRTGEKKIGILPYPPTYL
jgi:hypothetical protein